MTSKLISEDFMKFLIFSIFRQFRAHVKKTSDEWAEEKIP